MGKLHGRVGFQAGFAAKAPAPDGTTELTIRVPSRYLDDVESAVTETLERAERRTEYMRVVGEGLMPDPDDLPAPSVLAQIRRNAAAVRALADEFGVLASAEVADLAGHTSTNRSATAHRWESAGRLFHLTLHGQRLYPAFQFTPDGHPRAVIADVLNAFDGYGGLTVALWLTGRSALMPDGGRPVDFLESAPDLVASAARDAASDAW